MFNYKSYKSNHNIIKSKNVNGAKIWTIKENKDNLDNDYYEKYIKNYDISNNPKYNMYKLLRINNKN